MLEIRPGFVVLTDKAQVVLSKDLATEETRDKYSAGEERKQLKIAGELFEGLFCFQEN